MTGRSDGDTPYRPDASSGGRIAGTHAPAANVLYRRVLPGFSVMILVLGVAQYVFDHHHVYWEGLVLIATWLILWWANVRAPRTVVGPEGLRVRTGLRWREIPWADVHGVKDPTAWSTATMIIHTPTGEVTLPGLATKQADELLAYARTHTAPLAARPARRAAPPGPPNHPAPKRTPPEYRCSWTQAP